MFFLILLFAFLFPPIDYIIIIAYVRYNASFKEL